MKKIFSLFILTGFLYSFEINGEGNINNFYFIKDSVKLVPYNFHELQLNIKNGSEKYEFYSSFVLRAFEEKGTNLEKLSLPSFKLRTHLWEYYLSIYDFLFKNLDLKVGKQRIAWGKADKLNLTDVLNPFDFQNPFDFGKKYPSFSFLFDVYLPKETNFEVAFLPNFSPPLFPENFNFFEILNFYSPLLKNVKDTIIYPENKNFKNSMYAFKINSKILKFDFSLSYFYGFDNLPIFKNLIIENDTIKKIEYFFPKMHMAGFDFSGELKGIGIWGEFGYFIPRDTVIFSLFPSTPDTLLSSPYLKYVIGFDYNFKNGPYINFQFNHGFLFERYSPSIPNTLHDYYVLRIEKKFLREKIKFGLSGIGEVLNFKKLKNNYGYSIIPEFLYKIHDNLEMKIGLINISGKGKTLFNSFKDLDQFYLNLKVSF